MILNCLFRPPQDEDRGTTKIRLPSGAKKTIPSNARAQVRSEEDMRSFPDIHAWKAVRDQATSTL